MFFSTNPKNEWFQTVFGLAILTLLVLWFKRFDLSPYYEGFVQDKPYVFKQNNDIYDENGNQSKTYTKEKLTERYEHRQKYLDSTLPIEDIIHCHYDCPMYILTVKNTTFLSSRGYPIELNLEKLSTLVTSEKKKELEDFARKYIFKNDEEIKMSWYLCSLMG
jgi:hypothetical protein